MDTFILQIEGAKYWKLHKSPTLNDKLAINPSSDFTPSKVPDLFWEGVLEEGDLLYMPRGVVHHAHTVKGQGSVHVTISNQHHNTWGEMIAAGLQGLMS